MNAPKPDPRNRYRTTIIGLGVLVGLLVLRLITEAVPALFLSSLAYSLALALNTLALATAISGAGRIRRASIGYATCGWVYLIFAYFEAGGFGRIPPMLTSLLFDQVVSTGTGPRFGGGNTFGGGSVDRGQLLWVAHSLATIAAGAVGAWFALRLAGPHPWRSPFRLPGPAGDDLLRSWPGSAEKGPAARPVENVHPLDRTD